MLNSCMKIVTKSYAYLVARKTTVIVYCPNKALYKTVNFLEMRRLKNPLFLLRYLAYLVQLFLIWKIFVERNSFEVNMVEFWTRPLSTQFSGTRCEWHFSVNH